LSPPGIDLAYLKFIVIITHSEKETTTLFSRKARAKPLTMRIYQKANRDNCFLWPYPLTEKGDSTVMLMCGLSLSLVAFFVCLNAMSVRDDRKVRQALGSFVGSLGILPSGVQPDTGDKLLFKSPPIIDAQEDLASRGSGPAEAVNDLIRQTSGERWHKVITLEKSNEGLTIKLSNQAFFAPASARLKAENLNLLEKIGELILKSSCRVIIKGHTDNVPISSEKYGSNWELSADRAMNILQYFLKKGVPLNRLEAAGYGEYDPLLPNDTPDHRSINRRVEIHLMQAEQKETVSTSKEVNIHGFFFKMRNLLKE
jgi:chemotaxis protein MotB